MLSRAVRALGIALLAACLSGCAGVGIPYTSDPYEKLHWASGAIHLGGRPFPAQELIREAVRKDLSMLIGPGGHERAMRELETLLRSSRLQVGAVIPLALNFSALEAIPA